MCPRDDTACVQGILLGQKKGNKSPVIRLLHWFRRLKNGLG